MKNNCLFCAICAGEIPSFKIYEDDEVFAFLDINPISEGHTLVVPKRHSANLLEAEPETLAKTISRVRLIAAHLKKALGCDGFNIMQNNGECAGQSVHHLHFHIIPRRDGDKFAFKSHEGDMAALKALAAKITMVR